MFSRKKVLLLSIALCVLYTYPKELSEHVHKREMEKKLKKKKCKKLRFVKSADQINNKEEDDDKNPGLMARLFDDKYNESIEKLSPQELSKRIQYCKDNREIDELENYLTRMVTECTNQNELKDIRFELALNLFKQKLYEKAATELALFIEYYPTDKLTEFASYLEILCLDMSRCDFKRDQTETKALISKAHKFLSNQLYTKYKPYVQQIINDAYNDLILSETLRFEFYVNRKNLLTMKKIIEYMKKEIAPYVDIEGLLKDFESAVEDIQNGKPYVFKKSSPQQKREGSFRDRF